MFHMRRQAGHQELAERLVEIQYELTDRLTFYLCGRRPGKEKLLSGISLKDLCCLFLLRISSSLTSLILFQTTGTGNISSSHRWQTGTTQTHWVTLFPYAVYRNTDEENDPQYVITEVDSLTLDSEKLAFAQKYNCILIFPQMRTFGG